MDEIIKWVETEKVLNEYGMKLRNLYQDNLIRSDRIASGDLLNSVEFIVTKDNYSIQVSLQLAKYFRYVEWDTKPHWPPINKIEEWIKIKPVIPDERDGKLPTEKQLAFLIARKISEKGTKGSNDLHEAIKTVNDEYRELIRQAITLDIKSNFHTIFTEFFYKN